MTHEDALNEILANCCPSTKEGDKIRFDLDLCCAKAEIVATSNGDCTYNIISVGINQPGSWTPPP